MRVLGLAAQGGWAEYEQVSWKLLCMQKGAQQARPSRFKPFAVILVSSETFNGAPVTYQLPSGPVVRSFPFLCM